MVYQLAMWIPVDKQSVPTMPAIVQPNSLPAKPAADLVILVHGLAAPRLVMGPLERSLGRSFSRVINWGYPSLWSRIEQHGAALAHLLAEFDRSEYERIHLVTHSMGGIIARLALAEHIPQRIGRFVMIAPPNRGSHIATRLAPYLGRLCPPIAQLTDREGSYVQSLPPLTVAELGIIAARGDFMVPEPSTHLGCERDHIILPGLHSSLLWRQETAQQVRHFLQHGQFQRA